MKTYKVTALMTTPLEVTIEANSEDEAWDIAKNMDGGDFTPIEEAGRWEIEDVEEK